MSWRTIIEINHDCLPEVGAALAELVKMLPYASENEVRERLSMSSGVRFLARRHHSYDMKVVIAQSPDTPLEYVQGEDTDVATLLRGFDEGVFIRDIARDIEPGWAIKLLPYLAALGRLYKRVGISNGGPK
jgi:hypothetical protein